jgi:hypothetical protein
MENQSDKFNEYLAHPSRVGMKRERMESLTGTAPLAKQFAIAAETLSQVGEQASPVDSK